ITTPHSPKLSPITVLLTAKLSTASSNDQPTATAHPTATRASSVRTAANAIASRRCVVLARSPATGPSSRPAHSVAPDRGGVPGSSPGPAGRLPGGTGYVDLAAGDGPAARSSARAADGA